MIRSRRRFLETLSALPLVGRLHRRGRRTRGAPPRPRSGGARLLPGAGRPALHQRGGDVHGHDRLADAARSDGGDPVRLQALRDARRAARQGRPADRHARCASEAAMVTSGAASALTLGTAAVLTGKDRAEDRRPPQPRRHEERGHHPEGAPLRLRPRRPQLRRAAGGGGDAPKTWSARSTRRPR